MAALPAAQQEYFELHELGEIETGDANKTLGVSMLIGTSKPVMVAVLGFGAVVLMYLVTEELLVKAREQGDTAFGSATSFIGFLCYLSSSRRLRSRTDLCLFSGEYA